MRLWSYERTAIIREGARQRESSGLQNPAEVDAHRALNRPMK